MQAARCWRPALLVLVLGSPCFAAPNSGFWESDLETAKQMAARSNRLVLVHFGAPWCQPCQQLEREVFNQPGFGNDLKPYYVGVKLNYDSFPATARQYGVQSIPTDVILTPQGQLVERVQSPLSSTEFSSGLVRVANTARTGTAVAAARQQPQAMPTSTAAAPPTAPPIAPPPAAGDRYQDYYNRQAAQQASTAGVVAQQGSASQSAPPAAGPMLTQTSPAAAASMVNPQAPPQQPLQAPPQQAALQPPPGAPRAATAAMPGAPQIAAGNAPLGLDGYCPVSLREKQAWVLGDVRFGMQHHGRTYLFAGPEEMQRFQANPDRFSPVMRGDDPVLALDQGQTVPGSRMYGVSYADHVYLFCSEQTLQTFQQNPNRYAAEAVQARH